MRFKGKKRPRGLRGARQAEGVPAKKNDHGRASAAGGGKTQILVSELNLFFQKSGSLP